MANAKKNVFLIVLVLIFLLAAVLRIKTFALLRPLWYDEAALALSIITRNFFGFFAPLDHVQSAPPFFMMATKFLTYIFGDKEFVLRLIPLSASLGSIWVFYLYSKEFLVRKHSIIAANLLFAINYRAVYYAQEFKQYATDALLMMGALLIFQKTDIAKLSCKKAFLYGCAAFTAFLFSMPIAFAVGAFVLYSLPEMTKEKMKKIAAFLSPFICLGPFYYVFSLAPAKDIMLKSFAQMWYEGFLIAHPYSVWLILRGNFEYFFTPNFYNSNLVVLGIILLLGGLGFAIESVWGERKNKVISLSLLVILCAAAASALHMYPLKARVMLYILPVLICLFVKPLDSLSIRKKITGFVIIAITIFCFSDYTPKYIGQFFDKNIFENRNARGAMEFLSSGFKPEEYIVYNENSMAMYRYYSKYFNLKTENVYQIELREYQEDVYKGMLDKLPKGKSYWFYYAHDRKNKPTIPWVKKWAAKNGKILDEYYDKDSYVMHLEL